MSKKFSRVQQADKDKAALIDAVMGEGNKGGRPKKTDEPTRKFNANIPVSLYDAFKEKAEASGHTMTWLVLEFMKEYVEEDQ